MHSIANIKNVSREGGLKTFKLSDIFHFLPKSHRKAGDGLEYGCYPFFTSSQQQTKWLNEADHKTEAIILGTGGAPSAHCADNFSTSADVFVIAPKIPSVSARYVYYFLSGNKSILDRGFKGAGLRHLSRDYTQKILIPLPVDKNGNTDLAAQKRIVDILEGAEALKNKRAVADRKMSELVQALFVEMFGDKKSNWTRFKISEISKGSNAIRTGPFGSQLHHSEFVNTGIPVLGIDNVSSNKFQLGKQRCLPTENYLKFKKFRVYPGDVIVTIMGTVGRACVAPENLTECMSTKHLCVITPDTAKVNSLFLWGTLLFDDSVRRQTKNVAKGAIMEGWNSTIIKNLYISIPPITLQTQFAKKVKEIESQKEKQKQSAAKLDELFHALLSRAFCGKTI